MRGLGSERNAYSFQKWASKLRLLSPFLYIDFVFFPMANVGDFFDINK